MHVCVPASGQRRTGSAFITTSSRLDTRHTGESPSRMRPKSTDGAGTTGYRSVRALFPSHYRTDPDTGRVEAVRSSARVLAIREDRLRQMKSPTDDRRGPLLASGRPDPFRALTP